MLRSLALKTLRDSRRGLLLWSVVLIGTVALIMAVYLIVRDDPALNDLVKRYPDALKSVIGFGGALHYALPAGHLGSELFSFIIPVLPPSPRFPPAQVRWPERTSGGRWSCF